MEMMDVVDIYFGKEKSGGLILILLSGLAIGLGGLFWWLDKSALLQGAIVPLLALGLLAGIVGGTIYFRTDSQVDALKQTYHDDVRKFATEEQSRMYTVNRNWAIYKWIELVIILSALVGLLLASRQDYWVGCSIAALVMASCLLIFDVMSERSGRWYAEQLNILVPITTPD